MKVLKANKRFVDIWRANRAMFRSYSTSSLSKKIDDKELPNPKKSYDLSNRQEKILSDTNNEINKERVLGMLKRHKSLFSMLALAELPSFVITAYSVGVFDSIIIHALISAIPVLCLKGNEHHAWSKGRVKESLQLLSDIRELSKQIDSVKEAKLGQDVEGLAASLYQKDPIREYKLRTTNGSEKILELVTRGVNPNLVELYLLKFAIKSNFLKTVKALIAQGITTEFPGQVSAFDFALEICPKNLKMINLLKKEKGTEKDKDQIKLEKPYINNSSRGKKQIGY